MTWEELWKLLRQKPIQRDMSHRVRAVEHEAGKITSAKFYADYSPEKSDAYYAEMRKETGDLIAMIRMLCFRMGWDYHEIELEGNKGLQEFVTKRM